MTNESELPPISADAQFTPSDFQVVLQHLPDKCPLVGGQAVAWWAERYRSDDGEGSVVTSRDIDFWGGREELLQLAKQMNCRAVFPHQYEMTVWVGAIPLVIGGKRTLAEFLHTIPGLDTNNPDSACVEQALETENSQKRIQVLTPISLVFAKLHALRHFQQKERQDEMHLKVCLDTTKSFLIELLSAKEIRLALWNVKRLVECHQMSPSRRLEHEYGFGILKSVPIDVFQREAKSQEQSMEDRSKLERFCVDYWPRVLRKIDKS